MVPERFRLLQLVQWITIHFLASLSVAKQVNNNIKDYNTMRTFLYIHL